jgi:hypothetical protein
MIGVKIRGGVSRRMVEMRMRMRMKGWQEKPIKETSMCITIPTLAGICGICRNIGENKDGNKSVPISIKL